jgi:hypothetical protein
MLALIGRAVIIRSPGSLGFSMMILAAGFGYLWIAGELGFLVALHASIRRAIRSQTPLDAHGSAARCLRRTALTHRLIARATGWRKEIPFDQAAISSLQDPATH